MGKKNIFHLSVVLFGLFFLFSCEYEKILPELPDPSVKVSYAADIQPIWDNSCNGCHGAGLTPPDLSAANSYQILMTEGWVDTVNPNQSPIYLSIAPGGSMSQFTNTAKANLVLSWIQQGAFNN